ncbi:MAG: biotin/lipoyl-binding protein, partial [Hyphomicrobiaceae bacterium]|nr:biotin/lipoyl-binding protein [Hyphomicrobiaceae bacterium]
MLGLLSIAAMFGGVGGWAAIAEISGGVIAPGSIAVEGNTKKVQHLEGGIVAQIRVKNADLVEAGQELIALDSTEVRTQLQIIQGQIEELRARRARLFAERDQKASFPIELPGEAAPAVREVWVGQFSLFTARLEARDGREKQQLERIAQLTEVNRGTDSQRAAKEKQINLIADE